MTFREIVEMLGAPDKSCRTILKNHLETRRLTAEIVSKDLNFHLPQENFNVLLEESNLLHCVITGNKWAYVLNIRTQASSSGHCFKGQPRPKMAKPRSKTTTLDCRRVAHYKIWCYW